jgi:hypothetical protein
MSTSPVSPEDIRAAAAAHRELGPEYSDAVVASFLERVDRAVAARVEARLAVTSRAELARRAGRRTLLKGMAIGLCAGALAVGVAVSLPSELASARRHVAVVPNDIHLLPVLHIPLNDRRAIVRQNPARPGD